MPYRTSDFVNQTNQKLTSHFWSPTSPRARLYLVHGYAEHAKRYSEFAEFLNEVGIEVVSYDQRGHGLSEGLSAYIPRFELLLDDLQIFVEHMKTDLPTFLFGHSLGGLVAVKYCIERKPQNIKGLITSGAALKLDDDLSPVLRFMAPILSLIFPKLPTTPLDKTYLTRSPENMASYMNDPLNYLRGTRARTGAEMMKAIRETSFKLDEVRIPLLALHGSADKLTDPAGTRQLYENAQTDIKTLKLYDGLYHELIHEPEKKDSYGGYQVMGFEDRKFKTFVRRIAFKVHGIFAICLMLVFICSHSDMKAQNVLDEIIKRDYEEERLSFILSDLDQKFSVSIRCNETLLPADRYTYSFDEIPMREVLKIILLDATLDFIEYSPGKVIVVPKDMMPATTGITSSVPVLSPRDSTKEVRILGIYSDVASDMPHKVTGTILDAKNFEPIQDALVRNLTTGDFVISKYSGQFEFELMPGEYVLQISTLTHETSNETIDVRGGGEWEVMLEPKSFFIDEIVISVKSAGHTIQQPISGLEILNRKEIKQLTSFMGEADVIKSLLTLAGVSTAGDGMGGFNVRGGSIDQNLILQDGAILFNPSHVLGFFSTFNPDIVQTTSLNKGHIPANYGGRVSSVLDITLKEASMEKFSMNGGLGLVSSKLNVDLPVLKSKSSLLLSGRISYAGWMLEQIEDLDIQRSNAEFHDFNVKYSHKLTDRTKLVASYFRSADEFLYSNQFGYSWKNEIGTVQLRHILKDNISLALNASVGSLSNQQFEPEGSLAFDLSSGMTYWQLHGQTLLDVHGHVLRAGFDLVNYDSKPEVLRPLNASQTPFQEVPKENGRESGLYINDQWNISDDLALDFGLRFSMYWQIGPSSENQYADEFFFDPEQIIQTRTYLSGEKVLTYAGTEPRISLRYKIDDNHSFKLSYNRMFQYLHLLSNTSAPTPVDIWQVSNAHIKPLKSDNYSVGFFKRFSKDLEFSVDGYYRQLENTIDHREFAKLLLNHNIETGILVGQGRSYGAEFSIIKSGERFSGRFSYSFSKSERKTNKTTVETINNSKWFPSNFDQPHSAKFFVNWKISKKDRINVNFTFSTGRPITAPISNYTIQGVVVADYSDRNAFRLPDYHRLDIGYTYTFNRTRSARFKSDLSFSFYNVYARKNAFSIFSRQQIGSTVNALRLSVVGSMIPSVTYNFHF